MQRCFYINQELIKGTSCFLVWKMHCRASKIKNRGTRLFGAPKDLSAYMIVYLSILGASKYCLCMHVRHCAHFLEPNYIDLVARLN